MIKYIVRYCAMKMLKKADIIVIIAFLAVAGMLFITPVFSKGGRYVKITQDGQSSVYPVNENREIDIDSSGYKLTVVIENSEIYVKDAECPDKICEKTGRIKEGGSIVCIPAKVIVEFTESAGDNDALVG